MSGRIVGEVVRWAPRDLTPTQRLVLVTLAERAFDGDRTARKSVRKIADEVGVSARTATRALSELAYRGLIVRKMPFTGPDAVQVYYLAPLSPEHRRATQ